MSTRKFVSGNLREAVYPVLQQWVEIQAHKFFIQAWQDSLTYKCPKCLTTHTGFVVIGREAGATFDVLIFQSTLPTCHEIFVVQNTRLSDKIKATFEASIPKEGKVENHDYLSTFYSAKFTTEKEAVNLISQLFIFSNANEILAGMSLGVLFMEKFMQGEIQGQYTLETANIAKYQQLLANQLEPTFQLQSVTDPSELQKKFDELAYRNPFYLRNLDKIMTQSLTPQTMWVRIKRFVENLKIEDM